MLNGKEQAVAGASTPATVNDHHKTATIHQSNRSVPDVYRAICQVAKAISHEGVSKGRQNQQQGYRFRGIDEIMNALSPLLADAELVILPRMLSRTQEERRTRDDKPLFSVVVEAAFDFVSARDGSIHTVTMFGEAMDSADKASNKAMSAAFKYALLQAFCIPLEGTPDADATTHEPAPKPPATAPVPVPATPPAGTQAAADAVAVAKIQSRNAATSRPWTNRTEMKRVFDMLRETVGEVNYLETLSMFSVGPELQWKSLEQALECWNYLVAVSITGKC